MNINPRFVIRLAAGLVVLSLFAALPLTAQTIKDPGVLQALKDGKAKLRAGLNAWNVEQILAARDIFLKVCVLNKADQADLLYYVALADYRVASYYLTVSNSAEIERFAREGQQYAQKAMTLGSKSGEPDALYGTLIGMLLTIHPEEAMTLGMESFQYMAQADQKDPGNPRVNLLHGTYMLYVPAEYGGGPDAARGYLETAVALFEKETGGDPVKPDWGKDEGYLNLGLLYKQTNEPGKALEMLKKALAANPDYGRAKAEIAALEKK
jgi:tetratricopeptide (TPR) repeat protein